MEMIIQALKTKGILKVLIGTTVAVGITHVQVNETLKTISISLAIAYTLFQFYQNRPKK